MTRTEGVCFVMEKLKVAVIGCGCISCMHLDAIRDLELSELTAVCDIVPERARAASEKYSVPYYTDYKKMIDENRFDAVHLCLPHYIHTEAAQYALRHGVNVISEKPMSINYEDAAETVRLAEEAKLQYGVIFQCRYNTPTRLVKKRIEDGRLGSVKCGRVVLTWSRPDDYYDASDWKGTWDKEGGGVIIDQAIHSIDMANWFIDSEPVEIQSSLHNRNHKTMKVEDSAEGLIKYENGALLSFYAMNTYFINEPIEIRLFCENGTVRLSYDDAVISYNDGTVETVNNRVEDLVSYTGGKDYWGFQHAAQINQFYKSILGLEKLEISGKEALKIQKIICDIYNNDDNRFREKSLTK